MCFFFFSFLTCGAKTEEASNELGTLLNCVLCEQSLGVHVVGGVNVDCVATCEMCSSAFVVHVSTSYAKHFRSK